MIEFRIESSPDLLSLQNYKFVQDTVLLGSQKGDLILKDPSLEPTHAKLSFTKSNHLLCEVSKKVEYFWVNGKRMYGTKALSPGDRLKIGETFIEIINFGESPDLTKELMAKNYHEAIKNEPKLDHFLQSIEANLAELSKKKDELL